MTTRPRSSRRALVAALALSAAAWHGPLVAQPRVHDPSEATELSDRYDVARWSAPGALHPGLALTRIALAGLTLRARNDRPFDDGGITLAYGADASPTLLVRVSVAPDAAGARAALLGYLRGAQTTLVPMRDRAGADVRLGDSPEAAEAAAAAFGNVAVWVARTEHAGAETPSAAVVLSVFQRALASPGAPAFPSLTLVLAQAQGAGGAMHVILAGGAFDHVEARVRGGTLRGPARPAGIDVVPASRGPVELRVLATDALGRSVQRALILRGEPVARPH